jgi:hypothetical protein
MAHSADPALFMPEEAKRTSTPKRFLHMGCFALFEVSLKGGVVGVRVTFDFNVSLDGCATGMAQPNWTGLPLVIARFNAEACRKRPQPTFSDQDPALLSLRRRIQNLTTSLTHEI